MINCPNCGKKISEFAVNCPHCGKKNTVNGNDTVKVAELQKESRKQIILYIPIVLFTIPFVLSLISFIKSGDFAYITDTALNLGISFLCLQCTEKYSDWKFIDTIVFAVVSIKIAFYIINSIILFNYIEIARAYGKYSLKSYFDKIAYIESSAFDIKFSSGAFFANLTSLCFYLIPMILIVFFMVKKKIKIK